MSTVFWAVAGQSALFALVPWFIAFGFPWISVDNLWWIMIAISISVAYALAFGIGVAINGDSCETSNIGSIATNALVVPVVNFFILLSAMSFSALRQPIEALVGRFGPSERLLFAIVASYYAFWSTAIGTTVAGYQATVC